MKNNWLIGIVIGLACLAGACGGSAPAADGPSCAGARQGVRFCTDVDGAITNAQFESACTTQLGGTFSTGACDRTGAVGGCELAQNGASEITWVYQDSGATADQISQACDQNNQSFVKP